MEYSKIKKSLKKFGLNFNNKIVKAIEEIHKGTNEDSNLEDNEFVIASALNDLNARIQSLQESLTEISERVSQLENT